MSHCARVLVVAAAGLMVCMHSGCNMVSRRTLAQSQLRSQQLYGQNKMLAVQTGETQQSMQGLLSEKQQLEQQNASLKSNLDVANKRLNNLASEREELQKRYTNLLTSTRSGPSPLTDDATRRFEDLAKKYPEFQFDPQTGVSKIDSDILFDSGSAQLAPRAQELLRKFAEIINRNDVKKLNVLVVGHTDDRPIAKQSTAQAHPTNWHLSTHRAISVVQLLEKSGVDGPRMGATGYGPYQPVAPNTTDENRRQNRRVEIFVLAPDSVVAEWQTGPSKG